MHKYEKYRLKYRELCCLAMGGAKKEIHILRKSL